MLAHSLLTAAQLDFGGKLPEERDAASTSTTPPSTGPTLLSAADFRHLSFKTYRDPDADSPEASDDDSHNPEGLPNWMERVQSNPGHPRFFGKASGLMLIKPAVMSKHDFDGFNPKRATDFPGAFTRRPEYWNPRPVSGHVFARCTCRALKTSSASVGAKIAR